MSQFFASGGQSVGDSASTSVLPVNIQDGLVGSPCSPRDFLSKKKKKKNMNPLVLSTLASFRNGFSKSYLDM